MFKLDAAEYMMSICGADGLRERSSPGKSGSIFYLSHDDRFFIKTLKKTELKVWSCRTSFNVLFEYISYFYSCKHVYLLYLLRIYCSADLCRKFLFLWCSLRNFCVFSLSWQESVWACKGFLVCLFHDLSTFHFSFFLI